MRFKNVIILIFIAILSSTVSSNTVDQIYNKSVLLSEEITRNPFINDFMKKDDLSSIDKKEINLYLSKDNKISSTDFYQLLIYSILLQKCENEELVDYYTNRIYQLHNNNNEFMLTLYIYSIKYDWKIKNDVEFRIQYYKLYNNGYTYENIADIILSHSNNSSFTLEKDKDVFTSLTNLNNTNLSTKIDQMLNDLLSFNIPKLIEDSKNIDELFINDFQNMNISLINFISFFSSIIVNIFALLSALIFIKKRKIVYHVFSHKLPSKAPLIYHRIFAVFGTYILFSILGVYGLFMLFGYFSIKYLANKDRNIILITSILILFNIFANQFVSFLYISLPEKSSYSLYNSAYLGVYDNELYSLIVNFENQDDPMIVAARAIIEYKKGDYITSIEYWNKFSSLGNYLAEGLNNKANAYYMLGDFESAEKIYQEALSIKPLSEVYYNLSKLYLVHLQMDKHSEYIEQAMSMNSHFVDKYISHNNKYLPNNKASKNMISPLKMSTILTFIISDAFNSKYTISSFSQIFIILKLLIIIAFIFFIIKSKMRNPRICSICGMQICYNCVGTENICNICNTNLENVKSKILRNKIILELKYNSRTFEFKLYKMISLLVPGSYNILFRTTTFLSIAKIVIMVTLWTLVFYTFESQSLHLITAEIQNKINSIVYISLISIYIYNMFMSLKNYRIEKKNIVRPGGL